MRALPFHYASKSRPSGTLARFNISGDCGGSWYLSRDAASWSLIETPLGNQASETIIPQDIAWRLFTKGITKDEARTSVRVAGEDADLGWHVLNMIAIIG
jgi:hypothetical protein